MYAVVAFNDQRIGSFKYCKELLGDWQIYFNTHFIFEKLTNDEIEDYFLGSDHCCFKSITSFLSSVIEAFRFLMVSVLLSKSHAFAQSPRPTWW